MAAIKLDSKDRFILQALEDDGRALIKDISKKTGIPRDSVNYRIKKLRSSGIIKNIVPICDTNPMGYPVYVYIHAQVQVIDEKTEKEFQSFLKEHKNIIYACKTTGDYHYIFAIASKTIQEFDIVLREIMSHFPRLIKSYNTSMLIDELKYDSFYKLI